MLTAVIAIVLLFVSFANTRTALYLLVFATALSPEFIVGEIAGKGTGHRGITLRMEDFLLLVLGLKWLFRSVVFRGRGVAFKIPLTRPIMAYTAACIVATVLGVLAGRVNPLSGFFFVLKYFEYFFLYFMVINNITDRDQVRHLINAALLSCVIVSLYGIAQIPGGRRAGALFEGATPEPGTLGGYLVFMIAVASGLVARAETTYQKTLAVLVLLTAPIALMASGSRAAFVASGVVVLVVLLVNSTRPILTAGIVAMLLATPYWAPDFVKKRVAKTFQKEDPRFKTQSGLGVDPSTGQRIENYEQAFTNLVKQPVFGYGVTGFGILDAQYLKVLIEVGLVGFVSWLILIGTLFRQTLKVYRRPITPADRGLAGGFALGIIACLVDAVGVNTFIIVRIMEPFWFFAALVMVVPHLPAQPALPKGQGAGAVWPARSRLGPVRA